MNLRTVSVVVLTSFLAGPVVLAEDRVMVALGELGLDMKLRGIEARIFPAESDVLTFADVLADAGFLFCPMGSRDILLELIEKEINRTAIRALLARGGIMWFDDRYPYGNAKIAQFMMSLGAPMPGKGVLSKTGHGIGLVPKPGLSHPLIKGQADAMGYECWTTWPKGLEVLFVDADMPQHAGVLIADRVQGHGAVIYAKIVDGWRVERHEGVRPFIDNVLLRAFGPPPAPGETHPVFDIYRPRTPSANTAHLAGVHEMLWDASDATHRKIFLVSEPVGLARSAACIEFEWPRPRGIDIGVVRAFTAGGVELHAQQIAENRFAVSMPLRPYDDQLVAVYVGGKTASDVLAAGSLAIEKTSIGWRIHNDHFEALLSADRPRLWSMRSFGGASDNFFQSWGNSSRWMGNGTDFSSYSKNRKAAVDFQAEVVLDGPVRKTILYKTTFEKHDLVSEVSLVRGARTLFYRIRSTTPHDVTLETGWSPGDSMANDSLWYEAVDGLKRLPLVSDPASDYALDNHAKETWYAIADSEADEVAGGFRQRNRNSRFGLRLYSHHVHGQLALEDFSFTPEGVSGGWITSRGGPQVVRNAYVAWRNPPVVTGGPEQTRADAPIPRAPVFGKDFLRLHGSFRRFGPKNVSAGINTWGVSAVAGVRELAGNVVAMGDQMNRELWPGLFEEAGKRGLGVCLKGHHRRLGCMVEDRDEYLIRMRKIAAFKPDMYYIFDELAFSAYSEAGAEDFHQKTGLSLPKHTDITKLPDDTTYRELRWRMDVMTELTRERVAIGKASRPDAVTFAVTAGGQLGYEFPAYNDIEMWSKFIGTTCTDLYTTDFGFERFSMQYIRGAQGNRRPVLSVHGNTNSAHENDVNLASQLMNGANALWFFTFTYQTSARDRLGPIVDGYEMLRDTGLGKRLAGATPFAYAAVLAERSTFFDGIRRGEFRGRRPFYHWRLERQASLRNIPMDLVFASHLEEDLPRYRVLIVPSGRNMSEASTQCISEWVRAGGAVIVEGEALLTADMAELCGVQVADRVARKPLEIAGVGGPLTGVALEANSATVSMRPKAAAVIAITADSSVATEQKVGRGRAVAVSLLDVPHGLLRPLVLDLGGPLPAELDKESWADVRLSVHTDGKGSAIGVFNEHFSESRAVTLRLGKLPPDGKRVAINTSTGVHSQVADTMFLHLAPKQWNFIMLDPAVSASAPVAVGTPVKAPAYAPTVGMEFLRHKAKGKAPARKRTPGVIVVAVFRSERHHELPTDYGADAIMGKLLRQEKIAAEWIESISDESLTGFDVLVIPNMAVRASNLVADWQQSVREFVSNGGGALLIHHSAGHPALGGAPFPEIGSLGTFTTVRGMQVIADHPIATAAAVEQAFSDRLANPAFMAQIARTKLAVDTTFISGFPDYMPIEPGRLATVVTRSVVANRIGGDPTLVAGSVGDGRAVLAGFNIGAKCVKVNGQYVTTEELSPEEESILVNCIFWLGQ